MLRPGTKTSSAAAALLTPFGFAHGVTNHVYGKLPHGRHNLCNPFSDGSPRQPVRGQMPQTAAGPHASGRPVLP